MHSHSYAMKILPLFFKLFLLIALFQACEKIPDKEPTCSGEQAFKPLYFTEYDEIALFNGPVTDYTTKLVGYVEGNSASHSRYYTELRYTNICNLSYPLVEFEVWLKQHDSLAVLTAYVQETGNPNRTDLVFERFSNTTTYRTGASYTFETTSGFTPGALYMHMDFSFPHQGSSSADSAYFFSNLNQIKTTITAFKPG